MIKPDIPADESVRLETLRSLKILDTKPEERFDRVTRLARRLFDTRYALVTLIDANRQWFKSSQGLDVAETPRDISFCGHTILRDEILVVSDMHADDRFCDNPLVLANPDIRFYAGCPVAAPNGQRVGTLCIIDNKDRDLSESELGLLRELAGMVEQEFAVAEVVNTDPVTGVSNREGFVEIGQHLVALCQRNDLPVTLVHFRLPNLELIHRATGDAGVEKAVVEMAKLLMTNIRTSDIVGRFSDDAFLALLTGADDANVTAAQQRIMDLLDERNRKADATFELEVAANSLKYRHDEHGDVSGLIEALVNGDDEATEITGQWRLAQAG